MNNRYIICFAFVSFSFVLLFSSCKKDVPVENADYSLTEMFNNLDTAISRGWVFINNSRPLGATTWQAGDGTLFAGYSTDAAASDYVSIAASCSYPFDANRNFYSATVISAWMITPVLTAKNGDTVSFYTRTTNTDPYLPERLEVRMNTTGTGVDVGNDSSSVGQFTKVVLSINPKLVPGGYPNSWFEFHYVVSGLTAKTKTRFAFRYYKPINTLGNAHYYSELGYIGIDNFSFISK